jgi:hypothetical protein
MLQKSRAVLHVRIAEKSRAKNREGLMESIDFIIETAYTDLWKTRNLFGKLYLFLFG